MVIDSIANAAHYYPLSGDIETALRYLQNQDFTTMEPGRHEIEGSECFVIVVHYDTKPREQGMWDAHRKYIDIQYINSGAELMGYAHIDSLRQGEYQTDQDFLPLDGEGDFLTLREGVFMILMPQDGHMPGLELGKPGPVCKVVAKVPTLLR